MIYFSTLALARWNWSSLFSSSLRSDCFSCSSSVRRFCSLRVSEVSDPRVTSCTTKKKKVRTEHITHEKYLNDHISGFFLLLNVLNYSQHSYFGGAGTFFQFGVLWVVGVLGFVAAVGGICSPVARLGDVLQTREKINLLIWKTIDFLCGPFRL